MSEPVKDSRPTADQIAQLDFEAALALLEAEVDRLERGRLRLNEAIASHQLIQELSDHCQSLLDAASLQVSAIEATYIRESSALYQVDLLTGTARELSMANVHHDADVDDDAAESADDEDDADSLGF